MSVLTVFRQCFRAIQEKQLIIRASDQDKEFHFQDWFIKRLKETHLSFEQGGRNSYPDFRMVKFTEGYELKGLAYPGRDASFDSNSQAPTGFHNERAIYYVFGRYPQKPDGNKYPVVDFVICHGDFLNADHTYVHENKSIKGFGCYGDILIRDRKMYVVPTPFHLVEGVAHHSTLILPAAVVAARDFIEVGKLSRVEAAKMIVGYRFDLRSNKLVPMTVANPGAGKKHVFRAWRVRGDKKDRVSMRNIKAEDIGMDRDEDNEN